MEKNANYSITCDRKKRNNLSVQHAEASSILVQLCDWIIHTVDYYAAFEEWGRSTRADIEGSVGYIKWKVQSTITGMFVYTENFGKNSKETILWGRGFATML